MKDDKPGYVSSVTSLHYQKHGSNLGSVGVWLEKDEARMSIDRGKDVVVFSLTPKEARKLARALASIVRNIS